MTSTSDSLAIGSIAASVSYHPPNNLIKHHLRNNNNSNNNNDNNNNNSFFLFFFIKQNFIHRFKKNRLFTDSRI